MGVFAGHFAARARRRELRLAMLWGLGLFLVVALYLAGENRYELVVLRSAGPAFFAAWFILFVPGALFGALGWAAAMDVLGSDRSPGPWALSVSLLAGAAVAAVQHRSRERRGLPGPPS